jgi:hypothetical protein
MRRGATLLLLVVITLPVWLSFAPSVSASQLSACCRRDGKHHCSAAAEMASGVADPGGHAVTSVPQHCSVWRVVASGAVNFLPPRRASISDHRSPSVLIEYDAIIFVSSGFSSHTDRGPPVIS